MAILSSHSRNAFNQTSSLPTARDASSNPLSNLASILNKVPPAPAPPPAGRLTLFDEFQQGPSSHGQSVNHVAQNNLSAPTSIQRLNVQPPPSGGGLDAQIEGLAAGSLDSTSNAIQKVLSNPGNTKVINQSQGMSPAKAVENIAATVIQERNQGGRSAEAGPAEMKIKQELGLAEDVNLLGEEGLQRLMSHTEGVFKNSPRIAEAKQRYEAQSQKLEDAGILHVVAAGNDGILLGKMKELGVTYGEDASKSLLVNDKTVTVGASTEGNQSASFSSPNEEVDVAVNGVDVDVGGGKTDFGTSFSAPQVAATISDMFAANPNLSNDQVRGLLRQSAQDTAAPTELEGAGILDMNKARLLASLSSLGDLQAPSA